MQRKTYTRQRAKLQSPICATAQTNEGRTVKGVAKSYAQINYPGDDVDGPGVAETQQCKPENAQRGYKEFGLVIDFGNGKGVVVPHFRVWNWNTLPDYLP